MWTPLADVRIARPGLLAACACLLAGAAEGQPVADGASDLRFSGFGTVGVVRADAPAGWKYRRNLSQPGFSGKTSASVDSRLGLQLNYAPSARFELVGQLVAARRGPYAANSDSVSWAFGAYRPTENLTLRLGRLNVDAYLLADYRNVGFAYPYARPPVDFYSLLPSSLDGGDLAQTWTAGGAAWRARAYVGRSRTGDLSTGPAIEVTQIRGLVLTREADGLLLRANLSRSRLSGGLPALRPLLDGLGALAALPVPAIAAQAAALRSRIDIEDTVVNYAALGASYDWDDWQASAEYVRLFGRPVTSLSAHTVSLTRRFDSVSLFGGAAGVASRASVVQAPSWAESLAPVVGTQFAAQAQTLGSIASYAADRARAHQRTLFFGARWDLHPQVALKGQWDHVRIDPNGSALWANGTLDAGHANVLSLTLDFVF